MHGAAGLLAVLLVEHLKYYLLVFEVNNDRNLLLIEYLLFCVHRLASSWSHADLLLSVLTILHLLQMLFDHPV